MKTGIQIFNYNGSDITMKNENGIVYVNLTEIAKAFPEKNLSTIVNSQEISDYVRELSEIKNISSLDLLQVTKGNFSDGREQGTWAHQQVALRVCQKLSTKFAIWVDECIMGLIAKNLNAQLKHAEESARRRLYISNRIREIDMNINGLMDERKRLIKESNRINATDFQQLSLFAVGVGYERLLGEFPNKGKVLKLYNY